MEFWFRVVLAVGVIMAILWVDHHLLGQGLTGALAAIADGLF